MKTISLVVLGILLAACTQNNLAVDNSAPKNTNVISQKSTTKTVNKTAENIKPINLKTIPRFQGKKATPSEIAECQKLGGSVSKQGIGRFDMCVVEFSDKGKTCNDGSECQSGRCIANGKSPVGEKTKGVCAKNNVPFGCYAMVKNGQATDFWCVD